MSRSTRTLIAIVLWLLAGFMGINNIILGSELGDWVWPVILFVAGLILSLYPEGQAVVSSDHTHEPAHVPPPTPRPALDNPVTAPEPKAPAKPETVVPLMPEMVTEVESEPEPVAETPVADMVAEGAPAVVTGEPDDLTRIEGIGPKMSAALIAAGIETFAKLSVASEDELRDAIKSQGMRFAPSLITWAEQASYAAKGDWDGLATLQSDLKSGRQS